MKKFISFTVLILIVLAFFKPFFVNKLLPIPADTIVGLYYPFRDLYAATNPNGMPFHNFLITDPIRQQYPWRTLAIDIEKHVQLPLWNPYSFAGSPLLANFQSAALYPLNILFFMLPFASAWSILIVLEPLLGGIFLYLYLKNLKLHPISCLLGAITFGFSGFCVAWLEWNTVLHTVIWLPLILLAKDKLLEKWSVGWTCIFLFAEISAFFGGHLQSLFYALCISNVYLAIRIFQKSQAVGNGFKPFPTMVKIYIPFLIVGIVVFTITAIQWLPTLQFISLSARSIDQNWLQVGWFIPWQNLVQFVAPDFFGNPATGNYWGIWNYAEFVGYVGIAPLIVGLYALFFRHDRKTLFWGSLFFLSVLFAFPTFLAKLPFQLSIPFLSTAQPTRLLFVTDFSLAILSALGLDYFIKVKTNKILYPIGFLLCVFIGIWSVVLLNGKIHLIAPENLAIAKHNLYFPTLLFGLAFLFMGVSLFVKNKKIFLLLTTCYLLLTFFDLYRFGNKFETFSSSTYLYPSTKILSYLQQHAGNARVMTTDDRILPPDFSIMYHVQMVDGYDPLYLLQYGELIASSEREKPDISTPFGFNRIITPKNYNTPIIDMLGVKYILSLSDLQSTHLTKIMQDGQTRLYENQRAFPRAIFVDNVLTVTTKQKVIQKMFDNDFSLAATAIVQCNHCGKISSDGQMQGGLPEITQYSENRITLQTNMSHNTFLVLFDQYYPIWHAMIDNKQTTIFQTDYAFRGISVPAGKHSIIFYDTLF